MFTMNLKRIQDVLEAENKILFDALENKASDEEPVIDLGNARAATLASRKMPLKNLPVPESGYPGIIKGLRTHPRALLQDVLLTSSAGEVIAVGGVVNTPYSDEDEDLPVVLAVGINYGQGTKYLTQPVDLDDDTRMRRRLMKVKGFVDRGASGASSDDRKDGPKFHLIAHNLFPFITRIEWGDLGLNAIQESLLIQCFWEPTAQAITSIVAHVRPIQIVFHGANNAVPYFAAALMERIRAQAGETPDFVFCDNLAYGADVSNAVRLPEATPPRNNSVSEKTRPGPQDLHSLLSRVEDYLEEHPDALEAIATTISETLNCYAGSELPHVLLPVHSLPSDDKECMLERAANTETDEELYDLLMEVLDDQRPTTW